MNQDNLNIGIVGLGTLGSFHARSIAQHVQGAHLQAICSVRKEELERYGTELSVKQGYTSFEEMISKEDLDALVIASTSESHYEHVSTALKAGLHVFVEKPIAVTLEDSLKLQRLVREHPKQIFMIGFMRRFDEPYRHAKNEIEKGRIGKPYFVRSYSHDCIQSSKRVLAFSQGSGGLYVDVAIHDIDLMQWYLNEDVQSVYASGGCYVLEELRSRNDNDNACAFMQFQNKAMGFLFVGRTFAHGYHIETEIVGSEGILRIGAIPEQNTVSVFTEDGVTRSCNIDMLNRFGASYIEELRAFVQAIRDGHVSPYAATVDDAVQSFKVALACTQSLADDSLVRMEKLYAATTN